jgi:hypothetical protein
MVRWNNLNSPYGVYSQQHASRFDDEEVNAFMRWRNLT